MDAAVNSDSVHDYRQSTEDDMKQLTVVYNVPEDAPEWFSQCVEDGDWNGMLEYAMELRAESVRVT